MISLENSSRITERTIFMQDGYSEEWKEEAARRGLPNHANSVDTCLA